MNKLKNNSMAKHILWFFALIGLSIIVYLLAGSFASTSVFNGDFGFESQSAKNNIDPNFEEYKLWQEQFEVTPEKINNFTE